MLFWGSPSTQAVQLAHQKSAKMPIQSDILAVLSCSSEQVYHWKQDDPLIPEGPKGIQTMNIQAGWSVVFNQKLFLAVVMCYHEMASTDAVFSR